MAGFGVPDAVLASPHYQDAIFWVFTHMLVLGLVIGVVGYFAGGERTRRAFARLMCAAIAVFTGLDLHTSDSPVGSLGDSKTSRHSQYFPDCKRDLTPNEPQRIGQRGAVVAERCRKHQAIGKRT